MIFQMQFLSLLRLLEANISRPFERLMENLSWLNLHFSWKVGPLACDEASGMAAFVSRPRSVDDEGDTCVGKCAFGICACGR